MRLILIFVICDKIHGGDKIGGGDNGLVMLVTNKLIRWWGRKIHGNDDEDGWWESFIASSFARQEFVNSSAKLSTNWHPPRKHLQYEQKLIDQYSQNSLESNRLPNG